MGTMTGYSIFALGLTLCRFRQRLKVSVFGCLSHFACPGVLLGVEDNVFQFCRWSFTDRTNCSNPIMAFL